MREKARRGDRSDLVDSTESKKAEPEEACSIEISSGFSLSVGRDKEGRLLVRVRKYGDVDGRWVRREIERSYPGAIIQGLGKRKIVEVVTERQDSSSLEV